MKRERYSRDVYLRLLSGYGFGVTAVAVALAGDLTRWAVGGALCLAITGLVLVTSAGSKVREQKRTRDSR